MSKQVHLECSNDFECIAVLIQFIDPLNLILHFFDHFMKMFRNYNYTSDMSWIFYSLW